MSSAPVKASGWRFKGKTKYYLSLTLKRYKTKDSYDACRRDKRIQEKVISAIVNECKLNDTIYSDFDSSDFRYYGIPQPIINVYYNKLGIKSVLPWQQEVLSMNQNAVMKGGNLVYSAPTGIGKSLVYEILLFRRLRFWKGQVLLVLPFISLIEEKVSYLSSICEPHDIFVESFHSQGAQRLDPRIDIAISTVEKANIIVNRYIAEGQTNSINLLIVDEAQTIENERGYLLELLVMKLRLLNSHIQIIFLSATLPCPIQLSKWLDASLYIYDQHFSQSLLPYRSNLVEYYLLQGKLYSLSHQLLHDFSCPNRTSSLLSLIQWLYQSTSSSLSILIFCPTKARCEEVVKMLLPLIPPLSKIHSEAVTLSITRYNHNHPIKLDSRFMNYLQHGLCIHHAGLTDYERTIAETLFRQRHLQLLAATSTLSAGVNLNVDIVIIDGLCRCKKPYSVTEYQQMIGRTGRMGQSKQGSVYVILDSNEESFFQVIQQTKGNKNEEQVAAYEAKRYCRDDSYWKKAIIELIAGGFVSHPNGIIRELFCHSFYSSFFSPSNEMNDYFLIEFNKGPPESFHCSIHPSLQNLTNPLLQELLSSFLYLLEKGILRLILPVSIEIEEATSSLVEVVLTELGEAVYSGNLNVNEVCFIAQSMTELNNAVDISNSFQIIFHLTPLHIEISFPIELLLLYIESNLTEDDISYINREIVPISTLYDLRNGGRFETLSEKINKNIRRLRSCIVLQDLLRFNDIGKTSQFFRLNKGIVQNLQTASVIFYYTNMKILKALHYDFLYEVVKSFESDIAGDVTSEVLDLIQYGIELKDALILVSNGYLTIDSIVKEDTSVLLSLLVNHMPWQKAYCSSDQSIEEEDYYVKYVRYIEKLKKSYGK